MKALILAAGIGSRIRPITKGLPKCLLRFGDKTILDYQIESLFGAGADEIAIVVGHAKDHIMAHVYTRHPDKLDSITFIENTRYSVTNNVYSLWVARDWLSGGGFLCLNADVLYHPEILPPVIDAPSDISIVIDREFREETTKVIIRGGRVRALSKAISQDEYSGTFIGVAAFSSRGAAQLFARMEAEISAGQVKGFFNDVISRLCAEGVRVGFTETGGLPWTEVDDANDYVFAQTQIYPLLNSELSLTDLTCLAAVQS